MSDQSLPAPTDLFRQIGISDPGSPLTLSRGSSIASGSPRPPETPDQTMRRRLLTYKTYLEHELEFIDNEITALLHRTRGPDPQEESILDELRDGLKIRYNTLQTRLSKVQALVDVM